MSPRTFLFRSAPDFFGDLTIVLATKDGQAIECLPLTVPDLYHLRYKLERVLKYKDEKRLLPSKDDPFWSSDLERDE